MTELFCQVDCADEIPQRYDSGECAPIFRKFGSSLFVAFKCGLSFINLKDTAEWATKIAAGDIIVSPSFGNFAVGEGTTATVQGGCGETYPEYTETPFTFTTPSTSEDYSDEDWWYSFKKSAAGYTIAYLNCEGVIYPNDNTVAAYKAATTGAVPVSNPGFGMSLDSTPQFILGPNGIGKAGIWSVKGKISGSEVHRGIEIPGLYTILKATPAA
jgi:hypothetical protein